MKNGEEDEEGAILDWAGLGWVFACKLALRVEISMTLKNRQCIRIITGRIGGIWVADTNSGDNIHLEEKLINDTFFYRVSHDIGDKKLHLATHELVVLALS